MESILRNQVSETRRFAIETLSPSLIQPRGPLTHGGYITGRYHDVSDVPL